MSSAPIAGSSQSDSAARAIQAYVTAEAFEPGSLPPALAEALQSGTVSLLQLIRLLGEYLTSEDERVRLRGVELLAQVVLDLAPEPTKTSSPGLFDRQAVRTLAAFFADKLEDGTNVAASIAQATNSADKVLPVTAPSYRFKAVPEGTEMLASSLQALTTLARLDGFASEQTKATAQALIAHVKPREHPQAVRFMVYALLDALLSRHRAALKSLGKAFLKGYVDLAEGEKDPRNLMYLFSMDRVILIEWELDAELAEAFYDITYCYFPITFKPPPDDPYGITSDDLKTALRACLTANPLLAPHAMPLLLEKLAASGGNTKRDTLHTLEEAMPVFGRAAILANEKKLWEGFKVEIMAATDEETALFAQRALASFLRTLYHDVDEPTGIASRIVADALTELEEPEKSLAKPACDLLVAMVKACSSTSAVATYALFDQMLTMFKDPDVVSIRGPILRHMATLLQALRDTYQCAPVEIKQKSVVPDASSFKFAAPASTTTGSQDQVEDTVMTDTPAQSTRSYDSDGRPLDSMRDELLSALSNGMRSTDYRSSALLAFVHLTHIPTFLSPAETNYLAEGVNEIILSPAAEDVRAAALDGLRDIARINGTVLEETTLPLLFSRLPDRMRVTGSEAEARGTVRRALGALARLCVQPDLFETMVVRLFTKLDLVSATTFSSEAEREENVGYARGLLVTVLTVLEEKASKKHTDIPRYGTSLCPRLFSLVLAGATRAPAANASKAQSPLMTDPRILRDVGRIVSLLVRSVSVDKQKDLAASLGAAFLQGDVHKVLGKPAASSDLPFMPFAVDAPSLQRNTVYAFASALVASRKDALTTSVALRTTAPGSEISIAGWLELLLNFVFSAHNPVQADAGYALLATTVNKLLPEPIPAEVKSLLDQFWVARVRRNGPSTTREEGDRAIRAWFWVAKSLLVRSSSLGQSMLERSIDELFSNDLEDMESLVTAKGAARALELIAKADDGVLNKDNGAVIRMLYRQKLFSFLLPRIIKGYNDASSDASGRGQRSVFLIALASILPATPAQVIKDRLARIFPLLIQALDLPDDSARTSAAATIALATSTGRKERDVEIKEGSKVDEGMAKVSTALDLVEEHAHALVERLLKVARPDEHSSPKARVAALRCLATLVRCLPFATVLRAEQVRVLRALNGPGMGVDDPKKQVRMVAVDCKSAWHIAA